MPQSTTKFILKYRWQLFTFNWITVFNLLILGYPAVAQTRPVSIILTPQKPVVFHEFYIDGLIDNRLEKTKVAAVYLTGNNAQKQALQSIDLEGGAYRALTGFIRQSYPQNKNSRPVNIRLQVFKIVETLLPDGRVEGRFSLLLSFNLVQQDNEVHLFDYQLDNKYSRPQNQLVDYAKLLQKYLDSGIRNFNSWMEVHADHDPRLARKVIVLFKNHQDESAGDTIYYSPNRMLTFDDFQDKPHGSRYAAIVFPSFGFDEHKSVTNAEVLIELDMKVYLPKSACWVKNDSKNSYVLNHEQRHFDLVAIVAKHFEQQVAALKLPVNNCDGQINVEFYNYFREMNQLQKQYDDETQHGLNTFAQESWNNRIDQDLINLRIKTGS